jgi:hypothetical protein
MINSYKIKMESEGDFLEEGKVLTMQQRALKHAMLELKAENERERMRADPAFHANLSKDLRHKNLCDPQKTKLGERNVDFEEAQKIYKESVVKRSEIQTNFQKLFDKEVDSFNKRWRHF